MSTLATIAAWQTPSGFTDEGHLEVAKKTTTLAHEKRSGNVLADLGLPHPEQELLKARLTLPIYRIIKARCVTQAQAGALLGVKPPQGSLLMRNRSGNVSVERSMDFLTALGHDEEVRVTPTRKVHGRCGDPGVLHSSCRPDRAEGPQLNSGRELRSPIVEP